MCGIAGILGTGLAELETVRRMAAAVRHRGPDDEGYVALVAGGEGVQVAGAETAAGALPDDAPAFPSAAALGPHDVVLGARRLAILDLSPAGHQPMPSPDRRAWIVHNGEIYNYRELRRELVSRGHSFWGGSDTEVALAAYREWGTASFERFNGMWATAIWDGARQTLVLSRDRFGVKPLYLAARGGGVAFASEIKALLAAGTPARASEAALRGFLATGRIDDSPGETCFAGIAQVEPGTYVEWPLGGRPRTTRFYALEPRRTDARASEESLLELLDDSVRLRLRSDVTVGSCLSGGLDSSAICLLAQARLAPDGVRMQTFTFGSEGSALDETEQAAAAARAAGAEARFTGAPHDLAAELEATIRSQEEPVVSGSVVAQRRVMALAHEHGAKVLLDGQGGDEVLGGYSYYRPAMLADLVLSPGAGRAVRELRAAVGMDGLTTRWLLRATLGELRRRRPGLGRLAARQLDDVARHLPALLHYEDRNSMAFSIEARTPFLDYRLVELGLGLPGPAKIAGGWTKAVLRRALDGRLPDGIVWRRDKLQFQVPQVEWLRGPLRELAGDLLLAPAFATRPAIDPREARELFARVDSLDAAGSDRLWRMLAIELWHRSCVDAPVRATTQPPARAS